MPWEGMLLYGQGVPEIHHDISDLTCWKKDYEKASYWIEDEHLSTDLWTASHSDIMTT